MSYEFLLRTILTVSLMLLPGIAQAQWQAGVAKVNITPRQSMWMSGYASRQEPAQGKISDLWAKALVLQDDEGTRILIITLDLVGIERELAEKLLSQLTAAHGIPAERIAIFCSHTHSGPVIRSNLKPMYALSDEQWQLVEDYAVELQRNVASAVELAVADIEPCEASWGSGKATFAVNRRNNREADVPQLREQGMLQGPVDHTVPVLRIDVAGETKGLLFGYACHATVLSGQEWSADYPGFAQTELEERFPGAIALFWAGCGADQNPLPRRDVSLAQDYGRQLADAVEEVVLGSHRSALSGPIQAIRETVSLKFASIPTAAQLTESAKSTNVYEARRAVILQQQAAAGGIPDHYPYPVQSWQLGNGPLWVILGGEVVVDYANTIKERHGEQTWVAGYANDVMAYVPSRRVLHEGGYEGGGAMVYYGLPAPWSDDVEELILKTVGKQAEALLQRKSSH